MSLLAYLEQKEVPSERPALIDAESHRSITYGELWQQVNCFASGLTAIGLQPGMRIALVLPNSLSWVVSFLAILRIGGIVVPLRQSVTPVELKRLITQLKPSIVIADGAFINRSLPFDLLDETGEVVICSKRLLIKTRLRKRVHRFNTLLRWKALSLSVPSPSRSEVTSINYTFRGYGYPLGAMLTHDNYVQGIRAYTQTAGLHEGQRFLVALPLSHVYPLLGCLLAPLATGSTAILVQSSSPRRIWETIWKYRPNVLTGVPTLYANLLNAAHSFDNNEAPQIDEAICGGSFLPVSLYEQLRRRWNWSLRQGYGLTECLPVTCNPPATGNRPETLGKIVIGAEGVNVKIFEEGREAPVGKLGEIVVAGPTVMAGYYARPRETSDVLRDGWFYTGDCGWFDADGYLHFAGVKKRIAKVAGNMVDLAEIEREILSYPGVSDVSVSTVPDEKLGEIVHANIAHLGVFDSKAIRRYLKSRMASYKVPLVIQCAT